MNIVILISLLATAPLFMLIWLLNISRPSQDDLLTLSPMRWLVAVILIAFVSTWSRKQKSLTQSGLFTGLLVGLILLSNYCFVADILAFFILSSRMTKFRSSRKKKIENSFKEGGQRNWIQVCCNSIPAVQMALLYMIDYGCGEVEVNFARHYNASWLCMAVLGSLACCSGDTWASELGSVLGSGDPILVHTWQRVPRGTNGAVSIAGFIASLLGGLVVGLAHYLATLLTIPYHQLRESPPQWPLILVGTAAGGLGSMIDSVLGATLQYSGYSKSRGCVVESPPMSQEEEKDIVYISGSAILDNHGVNLMSSLIMALCTPRMAMYIWAYLS